MCVIWGIPYLLIRVAVRELDAGDARASAAPMIAALAARCRSQSCAASCASLARRWLPILVFAVIEIVMPWLLLARAETQLTSSLTGLLIAAVPLVGARS